MLKNFDEIKSQLAELAPIINSFKSEAVQRRIVDLIFNGARIEESDLEGELTEQTSEEKPKRKAKRKANGANTSSKAPKNKTTGSGPVVTLNALIDEGFFSTPQTLKQMIDHCKTNKARTFRANELSGYLGRCVSDGKLKRKKNSENQYEYWKP